MVVFLAAVLTFAVALSFEYTWDDPSLVAQVQAALSEGDVTGLFTSSFHVKTVQSARYFRPVMMGTLLVDVVLTGGSPWFSHLVNVLLHGINAVLLFFLFNLILGHRTGALAGALLFAVHPVHAEAVAAVSSRMDLLVLALILPAAIGWVSTEKNGEGWSQVAWFAASLSFFLACLTKETAFMFPVILVGWQVLSWKLPDKQKMVRISVLAFVACGALLARAAVFAREAGQGNQASQTSQAVGAVKAGALLPDASLWTSVKILLVNMRLPVFPFPGRSQWMGANFSPGAVTLLSAACFLVAVGWALRKNFSPAARGIAWWFIFSFPVLGIFNLGQTVAAERYAYIPSAGFCLVIAVLVACLPEKVLKKRAVLIGALLLLLSLGSWGAVHSLPWKNEVDLFRYVSRTNPGYPNGYLNLGVALAREGSRGEAMEVYNKALELAPGWDMALFNRGNLYSSMGQNPEALADFEELLQSDPGDWEAALNMGNVLAAMGRTEEARNAYEKAAVAQPSSGMPYVALAVLSSMKGEHETALQLFKEAAVRDPGLSEAYEGMGDSYLASGNIQLARDALFKALEISPSNARAAMKLGGLLINTGQPSLAVEAFRAALATDSTLVPAWTGLIQALRASGKGFEADRLIRGLDSSDPGLAVRVRKVVGTGR